MSSLSVGDSDGSMRLPLIGSGTSKIPPPTYAQAAASSASSRIPLDYQSALIRLQCFLDAGYQLDTAVKLCNAQPNEVPAPPGKSRTPAELLEVTDQTSQALIARGLALNFGTEGEPQRPAFQQYQHSQHESHDEQHQQYSRPQYQQQQYANSYGGYSSASTTSAVKTSEGSSSRPTCAVGDCRNVAFTKCQYPVGCCEEPCQVLLCVSHGQNIKVQRCLVTVCPAHAQACSIM